MAPGVEPFSIPLKKTGFISASRISLNWNGNGFPLIISVRFQMESNRRMVL